MTGDPRRDVAERLVILDKRLRGIKAYLGTSWTPDMSRRAQEQKDAAYRDFGSSVEWPLRDLLRSDPSEGREPDAWRIEGLGVGGEDLYLTNGRARLSLFSGEVEDPDLIALNEQLKRGTPSDSPAPHPADWAAYNEWLEEQRASDSPKREGPKTVAIVDNGPSLAMKVAGIAAAEPAESEEPWVFCGAMFGKRLRCELPEGHEGDHAAPSVEGAAPSPEGVAESTGMEGYAVVSLLFDTLDWPKEERLKAMDEMYRRWLARTPTEPGEADTETMGCGCVVKDGVVVKLCDGKAEMWGPAIRAIAEQADRKIMEADTQTTRQGEGK